MQWVNSNVTYLIAINFLSCLCCVDFPLAVAMFLNIFVPFFFLSQAFEQVKKKSPGCVFGTTGDIDTDKIWNSKYFQALLKTSKEKDGNQWVRNCSAID